MVPSHAAASTLSALLDALEVQTLARERVEILPVITAGDGSSGLLSERLKRWSGPPMRVIEGPVDRSPAAKRNAGAAEAAAPLLAFTDADCVPAPGWLEHGLAAHGRGATLVQGPVLVPEGEQATRLNHAITVHEDHGLYEGANMFYDRELFRQLGGFSTAYFAAYGRPFGEDAELGWRAIRAGANYEFCTSAVVHHPVSPPSLGRHLRERWLARGFPTLARDVPELRDRLFWHRVFLSRESAETAAAVLGLALVHPTRGASLVAVLPYARALARARSDAPVKLISDAVLGAALAQGSLKARCVVL